MLISIYTFIYFLNSILGVSLNPPKEIIEKDLSIDIETNLNQIKNSNNSNQINSNQAANESNKNNNIVIKVDLVDEDNKNNELNKEETNFTMNITNNYKSANYHYVKHNKTIVTCKSITKNSKNNENQYINKNKEILNPFIHFTNLSSKKLKILGSSSKSKTDNT